MIIPFFIPHAGCPHQCVFCDQKSITGNRMPPDPSSIPSTISSYLATAAPDVPVQVAFYGGSFTALPSEDQKRFLGAVQPFLASGRIASIRISTRPDAVTPDILALLKQYHVRTVELGAQSMDDEVLLLSGRGHTAAHTIRAAGLLREHTFLFGLQLMPGLPGDSATRFYETVSRIISLKPDFVRIYPAIVIRDTPLEGLYLTGRYMPLSLDDAVDICRNAMERFEAAGITVVRAGLQPTEELERPGTVVAGPWHPAFGQLVRSSRFLASMDALLEPEKASAPVTFAVNPADLASAIGQNRRNIRALQERYNRDTSIVADPSLPRGSVRKAPSGNTEKTGV